jgi:2-amino-4-hydroxy-6-hydroxymethyldihydropteridine diphosphokinase
MLILGLGSNVGARADYLARAIGALQASGIFLEPPIRSSVFESPAMLPENAPEDWNVSFLNMVIAGKTRQSPEEILAQVKSIEQLLGREARGHWGPREIDIDILAIEKRVIDLPELKVPHPGAMERDFVLLPLAELLPDWHYPAPGEHHGKTAQERLAELQQHGAISAHLMGPLERL